MSTERFKNVTSFVINLLNDKTINLLNLGESLSSDFSRRGHRPRRLSIRRYFARFRRIIVNYLKVITTPYLKGVRFNDSLRKYKIKRLIFHSY